jgi:hydrogenase-4 component F
MLLAIIVIPFAAALLCAVVPAPSRVAPAVTAVSGIASLALVMALVPAVATRDQAELTYLRADAVSLVFLLATAFLYAALSVYAVGYLRRGHDDRYLRRFPVPARGDDPPEPPDCAAATRYARRFCAGYNLFAWAMLAAPLMSSLALLWIAVEVTTIVSALLVAIEDTDGAAEAAWKYVLIASAGLGLALLGTILAYYAASRVLGEHFDLSYLPMISAGARLPRAPVMLAFVLATLGYGTKVGLFPVHTWLPDAHSEAPTPVSALLSGALLATSFYAILRFYQITARSVGSAFPRDVLLVFGVASLLLAALYVFGQRDVKRLLAYSSVEHMGILAIAVGFGAPIALAGMLLHVLAHAAAKGNAFMGAGVLTVKYGTKRIGAIRGGLRTLPWSGPLFLFAIFALSALPPSGIFRSEFQIVAGGLSTGGYAVTAILVAGVTLAFFGLSTEATRMLLARPARSLSAAAAHDPGAPGEPSTWLVAPVLAGVAVLVLLGVHPPGDLTDLIARAVTQLTVTHPGGAR